MANIILLTVLVFMSVVLIIASARNFNTPRAFLFSALACVSLILMYVIVLATVIDRAKNKVCAEVSPYTNRCISWVNK